MKPSDIKKASIEDLLARYARVRLDKLRFEQLMQKNMRERDEIHGELSKIRKLKSGLYVLAGRRVQINFLSSEIVVKTPVFKDIKELDNETK